MENFDYWTFLENTIFGGEYSRMYSDEWILPPIWHQLLLFHNYRPSSGLFYDFFKTLVDYNKIEDKEMIETFIKNAQNINIDPKSCKCFVRLTQILKEFFEYQDRDLLIPRKMIETITDMFNITIIYIEENEGQVTKSVYHKGENPIVIEYSDGRFHSIFSVHIKGQEEEFGYWPRSWMPKNPPDFDIALKISKIRKHKNYSQQLYFKLEDFYIKCPWHEEKLISYFKEYIEFTKQPLYHKVI